MIRIALATTLLSLATSCAMAQTTTSEPQTKGQTNIVVNPTESECHSGWNSSLKWSKEQFDQMCSTINKAK